MPGAAIAYQPFMAKLYNKLAYLCKPQAQRGYISDDPDRRRSPGFARLKEIVANMLFSSIMMVLANAAGTRHPHDPKQARNSSR